MPGLFLISMIYLFDCSGYDTVDDLFLQCHVQNQDRDDAEQKTCHDGSVICGVSSVEAVGGKRQSQQLFVGQHQGGSRKSFQNAIAFMITMVEMIGFNSGNTMRKKVWVWVQPSM